MEREFQEFISHKSTLCGDHEFTHILRDAIGEPIVENGIYSWDGDIADAKEYIYPIVFNIVFNSHFNIRHNAKAINHLIKFLLINYA